jgi:hypothetical protein
MTTYLVWVMTTGGPEPQRWIPDQWPEPDGKVLLAYYPVPSNMERFSIEELAKAFPYDGPDALHPEQLRDMPTGPMSMSADAPQPTSGVAGDGMSTVATDDSNELG